RYYYIHLWTWRDGLCNGIGIVNLTDSRCACLFQSIGRQCNGDNLHHCTDSGGAFSRINSSRKSSESKTNCSTKSRLTMGLFDKDLWSEVFSTLTKNMLRTILTTLGVIFAIIILILLLGATTGMSNGFNKIFAGTAANSMFMWSQSTSIAYGGFERGRHIDFTLEDVEMIKRQVDEVELISPRIQLGDFGGTSSVMRNGQSSGSSVYGDYPTIDQVSKKRIVEGRFLNQNDMDQA